MVIAFPIQLQDHHDKSRSRVIQSGFPRYHGKHWVNSDNPEPGAPPIFFMS